MKVLIYTKGLNVITLTGITDSTVAEDFLKSEETTELNKVSSIAEAIEKPKNKVEETNILSNLSKSVIDSNEALKHISTKVDLTRPLSSENIAKVNDVISNLSLADVSKVGGTLGQKNYLASLANNPCKLGNSTFGFNFKGPNNFLQGYSISALLLSMLCSGSKTAFSTLADVFKDDNTISEEAFAIAAKNVFNTSNKSSISILKDITDTDLGKKIGGYVTTSSGKLWDFVAGDDTETIDPVQTYKDAMGGVNTMFEGWSNGSSGKVDLSSIENNTRIQSLAMKSAKSEIVKPPAGTEITSPLKLDTKIACLSMLK